MFKIYQKYLIKNFLNKIYKVSAVFLLLIFILSLLEELNFSKELETNFFFPYLLSLLNLPITLFEIFPFIFIISTQFFLYDLFKKDELNLIKKSGISNIRILKILFILTIFIGIFNVFIYYNFAAKLKFYYSDIKNSLSKDNKYLAMVTDNGLWIKDEINEKKYIIKSKFIEKQFLTENIINEFDNKFELIRTIRSNKIDITTKNWVIFNPIITIENKTNRVGENITLMSNFDSNLINNIFNNISTLDMLSLHELKKNYARLGYSTNEIDVQMLKLFSTPFIYALYTIFAVTIMFNLTRNKPLLLNIVIGILLSVLIYYMNFIFYSLGVNGKLPIYPSVFFPLFLISILSSIGLVNLNEK